MITHKRDGSGQCTNAVQKIDKLIKINTKLQQQTESMQSQSQKQSDLVEQMDEEVKEMEQEIDKLIKINTKLQQQTESMQSQSQSTQRESMQWVFLHFLVLFCLVFVTNLSS
eukprot:668949_1